MALDQLKSYLMEKLSAFVTSSTFCLFVCHCTPSRLTDKCTAVALSAITQTFMSTSQHLLQPYILYVPIGHLLSKPFDYHQTQPPRVACTTTSSPSATASRLHVIPLYDGNFPPFSPDETLALKQVTWAPILSKM